MKVLFVGGTGVISSASTALAAERGMRLTLLNRGQTSRPVPAGVETLQADIRNSASVEAVLSGRTFDAVVDWVCFTPGHAETDLRLFAGRTGQFVFISSASAYQTPPSHLPVTESTPLVNPVWAYSRNKIACEEIFMKAHRDDRFPVTIVRPSHTYDRTLLPTHGRYTDIDRMRRGKKVVVHGDGSSLWTLTHHADFAVGLVGLLGNPQALGEAFHITSDESLTWNQIVGILGRAAGAEPKITHIPSELIAAYFPDWGDSLLGDKTHSMIFDNSKIRRLVPDFNPSIPFARGAEEILAWYDGDPKRRQSDPDYERTLDRMIAAYEAAFPK
ncbi:MAG: SDR family oxidoreductase [bacterium]|nr:SDR family oxidoreductase [bacterium]